MSARFDVVLTSRDVTVRWWKDGDVWETPPPHQAFDGAARAEVPGETIRLQGTEVTERMVARRYTRVTNVARRSGTGA